MRGTFYLWNQSDSNQSAITLPKNIGRAFVKIHKYIKAKTGSILDQELSQQTKISLKTIHSMVDIGLLQSSRRPVQEAKKPAFQSKNKAMDSIPASIRDMQFPTTSFFRVPKNFPIKSVDVALIGLPIAEPGPESEGTEVGYHLLRQRTMRLNWLDIFKDGIYSEMIMNGSPQVICKDIALADCGFVNSDGKKLLQVIKEIKQHLKGLIKAGTRPIFVGGDHSITYPIILAWEQIDPKSIKDLTIVHLDAHHDYYMYETPVFAHGAPIFNILETTSVKKVLSFGLRRFHDGRCTSTFVKARERHLASGRLKQFGIFETLECVREPSKLNTILGAKSKIFLTIDIDCLSSDLVDGATSTPQKGTGFSWHELFRFIDEVSKQCEIVGVDIVEYSPCGKMATATLPALTGFLLFLIDILGRQSQKMK